MARETAVAFNGFRGGVNLRDSLDQVDITEARNICNMILEERGAAAKRPGSQAVMESLAGDVLSLHAFYRPGTTTQLIAHLDDGSVRYSTDFSTWAGTITSGKSTTEPYRFCTYKNLVIMTNGTNPTATWDGSSYAEPGGAPKGKVIHAWRDAVWIGNIPASTDGESLIQSSAAGDPTSWPGANTNYIGRGDGSRIRNIHSRGEALIVFKCRSHHVVYDPVTLATRLTDPAVGCCGPAGAVAFDGEVYFLGRTGIYRWRDGASELLSERINPVFTAGLLALESIENAGAYVFNSRVGFTVPSQGLTIPDVQIELYPHYENTPMAFHRMPMRGSVVTVNRDGGEQLYFGSNADETLFRGFVPGVSDDGGTPFAGCIDTGWTDFQMPFSRKYLRRARVLGRGDFNIGVASDYREEAGRTYPIQLADSIDLWADGSDPSDLWGGGNDPTDLWGPKATFGEVVFHPDIYLRQMGLRFSDGGVTTIGARLFRFADTPVSQSLGSWAVYRAVIHAIEMGTF